MWGSRRNSDVSFLNFYRVPLWQTGSRWTQLRPRWWTTPGKSGPCSFPGSSKFPLFQVGIYSASDYALELKSVENSGQLVDETPFDKADVLIVHVHEKKVNKNTGGLMLN